MYEIEVRLRKISGRIEVQGLIMDDSDGIDVAASRISPEPIDRAIIDEVHTLVVENAPKAYQIKTETRNGPKAEQFLRDLVNDFLRGK